MKIGIFGGTFDPIHNAHIIIAQYAKEQFVLDRLIFVPCGNPPHKKSMTDKAIRFSMTNLAVGDEFEISDYEVNREEYSYTLSTLQHFTSEYPGDEIYLIIGEDSLEDIEKWHKPKEILKLCKLLVFPRNSIKELLEKIEYTKTAIGGEIFPIEAPIFEISSTHIRNCLKSGKSVRHMLPQKVLEYIEENDLYKE